MTRLRSSATVLVVLSALQVAVTPLVYRSQVRTWTVGALTLAICIAYLGVERAPWRDRARLGLVLLFLGIFLAWPQVQAIQASRDSAPARAHTNDGVSQAREAGRALLRGQDPYGHFYGNSAMSQARVEDLLDNPAWYHYAYPPLSILTSALGLVVMGDGYDHRMLFLLALFLATLAWWRLGRSPDQGLAFALLALGTPLYLIDWLNGQNEILFLAALLGSLAFLQRGRMGWSGILLGLAVATKQTALLAVPFYLVLLLRRPASVDQRLRAVVAAILAAGLLIVPLASLNPGAYLGDVLGYLSAGGAHNYPVHGFGFGTWLLQRGVIASIWDPYPFWKWQLGAGGAVMAVSLVVLWRRPNRSRLLWGLAMTTLVFSYFHRAFHENYLVLALVLGLPALWAALEGDGISLWEFSRAVPEAGSVRAVEDRQPENGGDAAVDLGL